MSCAELSHGSTAAFSIQALEIKHMQNTAVMDSFRSKLADFNDKLRVHTHDEIYEFVDVQVRQRLQSRTTALHCPCVMADTSSSTA